MLINRIIPATLIIFLFGISAYAQGDYLKYGETGLDINAMWQIDDDGVGNFGGNTGISLKGVVDLSFSVLATQKTSYALGIALNPLKQKGTGSPVGFSFSYSIASTTIDKLLSDNAYAFGPTIFSNIRFKPNMAALLILGRA